MSPAKLIKRYDESLFS